MDITELIERYYKGNATVAEEKELLDWVKLSSENRDCFVSAGEKIEKNLVNCHDYSTEEPWIRFQSTILKTEKCEPTKARRTYTNLLRYAAVFVVGVLFSSVAYYIVDNRRAKTDEIIELAATKTQTISTPRGARSNFILPDGSKVWLNAGSSLTFPLNVKKDRKVSLEGEAYFEVEKNGKPFIVTSIYGEVLVKGTSFNVKAYNDDAFLTTVESGVVNVKLPRTGNNIDLNVGEQSYINKKNALLAREVDTKIYTSWKDGFLVFYRDPLDVVVKKLERWYNVDIQVAPRTKIKNFKFTGTIEMESLTEVLELIRVTAPIKYTYDVKKREVVIDMKNI